VYQGTFRVPLASALSFVQESTARLNAKDYPGAVAAAQQAVAIAPDGFDPQVALGDALTADGRKDEAKQAYGRALELVKMMEPEAQEVWGPVVLKKMGS
jgi:Flp pilus assembly protein TadD